MKTRTAVGQLDAAARCFPFKKHPHVTFISARSAPIWILSNRRAVQQRWLRIYYQMMFGVMLLVTTGIVKLQHAVEDKSLDYELFALVLRCLLRACYQYLLLLLNRMLFVVSGCLCNICSVRFIMSVGRRVELSNSHYLTILLKVTARIVWHLKFPIICKQL